MTYSKPFSKKPSSPAGRTPYQLLFVTPGISPFKASWRKHKRQMPYLLRNPRGRPHRQQRFRWRHLNFGFLSSFAILAMVAMYWILS